MRTTDFSTIGSFFSNGDKISFVSLAEENLFNSSSFIESNGFFKLQDMEITSAFLEDKTSIFDYVNIVKALPFITSQKIKIDLREEKFPEILKISYIKSLKEKTSFPLTQLAKAIVLQGVEFLPFRTESRLVLSDYATKMPKEGDVVIFPTIVKGYKTVYPKSFDSWVKLLLKAKEFKTVNKEFLILKSLFDIK